MGRQTEIVTLGSVRVQIRELKGTIGGLVGLRVLALLGVAGSILVDEAFASRPEKRTTQQLRAALDGIIGVVRHADTREVQAISAEMMRETYFVSGEIVSATPLDFDVVFEEEPGRIWFWYELFVRQIGVNFADFLARGGSFLESQRSRLATRKDE